MITILIRISLISLIFTTKIGAITQTQSVFYNCPDIINYSRLDLGTNNLTSLLRRHLLLQQQNLLSSIGKALSDDRKSELSEINKSLKSTMNSSPAKWSLIYGPQNSQLEIFSYKKEWIDKFGTQAGEWDQFSFKMLIQLMEIYSNLDPTILEQAKTVQREYLKTLSHTNEKTISSLINELNSLITKMQNHLYISLALGSNPASYICSDNATSLFEQIACVENSTPNLEESILDDLQDLAEVVDSQTPQNPMTNDLEIKSINYPRNVNAEYCKRDPDLMSMIVLHHTETDMDQTPLQINRSHLNKPGYYMLGYNYLVSMDYQGGSIEEPQVFTGRPLEIQGAHASQYNKVPIKELDKSKLEGRYILCGTEGKDFKPRDIWKMAQEDGGLSGNFLGVGVSVIGNFEPITYTNIGGVRTPSTVLTTEELTPSDGLIKKLGQLICKLQKQNPNLKTLVSHRYFRNTDCPGKLREVLDQIVTHANSLGCSFEANNSSESERNL